MPGIVIDFKAVRDLLALAEDVESRLLNDGAPEAEPLQTFGSWARKSRVYRAVFLVTILVSLVNIGTHLALPFGLPEPWMGALSPMLFAANLLVILVIAIYVTQAGGYNPELGEQKTARVERGIGAVRRLLYFWPMLWLSWFVLYLVLLLDVAGIKFGSYTSALLNLCNNLSGMIFFMMYYEMAEETHSKHKDGPTPTWIPALMVLLLVAGIEAVATLNLPGHQADVANGFGLLSGIITGLTTGLLATRFASKVIDVPTWVVVSLVIYAVIQPVFPIISNHKGAVDEFLAPLFATIGLYCKVILFGVVTWSRETHRLFYYMVRLAWILENEALVRSRTLLVFERMRTTQPEARPAEGIGLVR